MNSFAPELQKAIQSGQYKAEEVPWVKFAHVWAAMELTLHKKWMNEDPRRYFRLSEKNMPTPDNMERAKLLAGFLGNAQMPEAQLQEMVQVYKPVTCNQTHWDMMHKIVARPE